MRIKGIARILLGATVLCCLLLSVGCAATSNGSSATENGGSALGLADSDTPPLVAAVKPEGDWAATMLAGGTVGGGMFPAKFTFDITATPSCTNDFVAMNTSLTGASASAFATNTGTWSGAVATGGTVTISSPEGTMVLTASTTLNTGTNFQVITSTTVEATNLAAAINRNNFATLGPGHLKVRATSAAAVVTVNASADGTTNLNGSEGNLVTLAQAILPAGRFTWTGANLAGGVGTGNIVAFNKLYATQGSAGGLCNQDGPSVYWSYFTGTGQALTSVVLSGDGTKVAFVESAAGGTNLRILKWKAGEGSGAGYPVAPTTTLGAGQSWAANCPAANSCIKSIAFNGAAITDTRSAPFYNYNTDTLYVGDDNSRMHKFTGVFNGTPAEVVVGWPITVNGTANLTGPVYDGVSGNIYVGDDTGRLSFIREVGSSVGACGAGSPPCLGSVNLQVGVGGAIVDPPIVDGTTGRVFATNGSETSNNGMILQASTALTGAVSFDIGGTSGPGAAAIYGGAFDNNYINSTSPTKIGHMYVCGKDTSAGGRPGIYQLNFNGTGVLTSVGTALVGLVSAGSGAGSQTCTPVTEVYNPNASGGAKDWIFFAIADNANTVNPIPAGSTCRTAQEGCLISIDVTGNPTWPPTVVTNARPLPPAAIGSASGIVVDNVADTATSPQASSIYLTFLVNSTTNAPCNGKTGMGCALKLTQSALQ